jgi:hypothetical protein
MSLPTEEQFARNLIGCRWEFPGIPFDYEVRSPLDGTVTAVAAGPLSLPLLCVPYRAAPGRAAARPGARLDRRPAGQRSHGACRGHTR